MPIKRLGAFAENCQYLDHGYIDTAIAGVFQHEHVAREREAAERRQAREQRLIAEDDDSPDGGWEVSWRVEKYAVS